MMRKHTVENFELKKSSEGRYWVSWQKDGRRYHVWYILTGPGLDTQLHSNPVTDIPGRNGHRLLNFTAKAWLPMREDVLAHLSAENITKADAAFEAKEHDDREAEADRRYAAAVLRVNKAIEGLDRDKAARNVFCALLAIPRDDLLRLL